MSVECAGIRFQYRGGFELGPIDLTLRPGVTCLVGANGAGKTTLFRIVAGIQKPSHGSVKGAEDVQIGYLPQEPDLPGNARCEDYLRYVGWAQKIPRTQIESAIDTVLSAFDLAQHRRKRIRQLSGGMMRRLAVAQSVLHSPDLLLLDEPTAGLDPVQRATLRESIRENSAQRTTLVSTHLVEDVRGIADHIVVLAEGRIVFSDGIPALEMLARDDAPGATELERGLAVAIQDGAKQ
ncbi:ABC-type multidrug transport system, ATPase component [Micrococcales bacterium KH10]|nr:ABC-type multidrug transport system, ATPase component [Micrococcales bacterium KH10]